MFSVPGGGEWGSGIWEGSTPWGSDGVGGASASAICVLGEEAKSFGDVKTAGGESSRRRRSSNSACALSTDGVSGAV